MYDILKARNDFLQEEVIDFTKTLIQTQSYSLKEEKCAQLCREKMESLRYDKVLTDKVGNVVGIIYGRQYSPTVLLISHLDTVPVPANVAWQTDPLTPEIIDNKLYGLGASDCKSGIAGQIYAGTLLKQSLLPLNGNLIVAVTTAEENGLSLGVKTLLKETLPGLNLKPDYIILGEPTDLKINYGHDGWIQYDIIIDGTDKTQVELTQDRIYNNFYHSSMHETSAIYELFRIHKNNPFYQNGKNQAVINYAARVNNIQHEDNHLMLLNHNCNQLKSPYQVNVNVKVHQEKQSLYTGINTIIEYRTHAWETDPYSKLIERAGQALDAAGLPSEKGKWKLKKLGMGTSGSVTTNEFKIPTIGYGPGSEECAHEKNEYVLLDNISRCVYGTCSIVHSLIGVPVFGWTSDEI